MNERQFFDKIRRQINADSLTTSSWEEVTRFDRKMQRKKASGADTY